MPAYTISVEFADGRTVSDTRNLPGSATMLAESFIGRANTEDRGFPTRADRDLARQMVADAGTFASAEAVLPFGRVTVERV